MAHHTQGRPRTRPGRRGILGERLRKARTKLALTQEEAADALGVSPVTMARWETGSSRPIGPGRRYVEQWVAAALGEGVDRGA